MIAESSRELPSHVEGAVRTIAQLQAEHHQSSSAVEHAIDRVTAAIGRPASLSILTLLVAAWMGVMQDRSDEKRTKYVF